MERRTLKGIMTRANVLEESADDAERIVKGENPVIAEANTPLTSQILIISLVANLLGLAMPLAIFQVYDRILPNQAGSTLF